MHESQKWVFNSVKAYFFRKFADRGGGEGVAPPFQFKKN